MADPVGDNPTPPGESNVAALISAAGAIFTFISGVSLSGTLGRVVRNDGDLLQVAFVLVLVGAALLVAAGLSTTGKFLEVVFSIIGLELTLAGFVVAGVLVARSGGHQERPSVTAQLDQASSSVKGKVTVGSMASSARVVTLVQGVGKRGSGPPVVLSRSDIGPNDEGKVDYEYSARVPTGRYDHLRVVAWTVDGDAKSDTTDADAICRLTKAPAPEDTPTKAGKACVTLPISQVAAAPGLEAEWVDTHANQLAVHLVSGSAAAGTRVVVVVKQKKSSKGFDRFYRAIFAPDADGNLDTKFKVPVKSGSRRICVSAKYLKANDKPFVRCRGSLNDFTRRQAVVHLTRP